ncbi:iron-containing alcohol dehydrogenase [Acidaminococcus massiliensis]|uniref:iron-containing alcohol dehydrogenase n=1 Tax=Acidaminococcus massiliensis TaxID=1852375 RepID=UPI00094E1E0C|nr:iron-containing alcohol dehydrogenase [Acidaminococcus massiliensis]
MRSFTFKVPQNVVFGRGALKQLPDILQTENAASVFLVADKGLQQVGLVDKTKAILAEKGIACQEFIDLSVNPTVGNVETATEAFKASGCKSIVALGGGGPMDVAKSVAILVTYGGKITDYAGLGKVPGPVLPLIAIPTTAGTGSEVTASSVITDEKTHFKMAIISYNICPTYALLDPELVMTVPRSVAAACGVDAFIHAMEAYVSKTSSPFTDAMGEHAMRMIGGNIRRYVASRDDEEAASNMLVGSMLAGLAFAWGKLGNIHAMSHPVSGFFHVPHGVANAILMPVIVEYNALADQGRYRVIYDSITQGAKADEYFIPEMLVEELRNLNRELGIPEKLSDVGVTEDKIGVMAIDAMKSVNVVVNPRQTTIQDIEALYRKLL